MARTSNLNNLYFGVGVLCEYAVTINNHDFQDL